MAIVKMNKFTLLTFESHRSELLKRFQKFSKVEFLNLQEGNDFDLNTDMSGSDYEGLEDNLSKAKKNLELLYKYVPKKSALKALKEGKVNLTLEELEDKVNSYSLDAIVEKISEKENEILSLENKISELTNQGEILKPYENFDVSFQDLKTLKVPYFLGSISKSYEDTLVSTYSNDYLEIISRDLDNLYFLLIVHNEEEETINNLKSYGFREFKGEFSDVALNILHNNTDIIEKTKAKIFFLKEELASYEEEQRELELICEYYGNMLIRKEAINNFLKSEKVIVLQGWVPKESKESLTDIVKDVTDIYNYLEFEDVKESEYSKVPIKLKNNELNTAFEDVTKMYSIPKYDEIDPTPFVAPFYLLFFGMMVADMGYGLVLLIATFVISKTCNLTKSMKSFMKFFFYLSFPTIGFGAIYGSFFGDLIALPKLIDTNRDINTVLIASVGFGVVQIFFGLGIKAYMYIRDGKIMDAVYDVGAWVLSLISLALVIMGGSIGLPSIGKKVAIVTMIIGMVTIVLTGGRDEKTTGARLGFGAYSLYGITSYIGDLVSYTRLMAIGLSGGSLAAAMNLMMGMLPSGVIAIIFAPVIFIFGHIFNLGLSLLGAYVHTCRLQYVEYFGKFYEGGGKAFKPFETQNKYINVKKD